ncbi:unnamed protein product [Ilex paraguariensis]|uniref:Uncharacterized protein n=1 Tax=Ilex paraguariensis TaxID=185542 RepID=A0ABC8SJG2_9AQUA
MIVILWKPLVEPIYKLAASVRLVLSSKVQMGHFDPMGDLMLLAVYVVHLVNVTWILLLPLLGIEHGMRPSPYGKEESAHGSAGHEGPLTLARMNLTGLIPDYLRSHSTL